MNPFRPRPRGRARRFTRTAASYVVGAAAVLGTAEIFQDALGLPDGLLRILALAALGGFPVALAVAWAVDARGADPGSRRLAAVWLADVNGYSGLSAADEAAADDVVAELRELAEAGVAAVGGRILKATGDTVLAVFESADAAVRSALMLGRAFDASDAGRVHRCRLSVGIHVGEIVESPDGDVRGDGVSLAIRVEGLSAPGDVVVSQDVERVLRGRGEYVFEPRGEHVVKGAAEPLRVYRVDLAPDVEVPTFLRASAPGLRVHRGRLAVVGVALLTLLAGAYLVRASVGVVGPESLVAQGVLEEGDELVLADFQGAADPALAQVVTEALRVDLRGSPTFGLKEPARVRQVLALMERPADEPLTEVLAREVAVREGASAVIAGEIGPVGDGYVLLARIVTPEEGTTLASVRETADGRDDLIDAVDALSAAIRRGVGESLRSTRASEPLRSVTTASLPALRSYTVGMRAFLDGDPPRAVSHLRDAVERDPDFAMAWAALGPALQSSRATEAEWREALTQAYRFRERLTPLERYITEAAYHQVVSLDLDAEVHAQERILELVPDRDGTMNNLGMAIAKGYGRYDEAEALMERAIEVGHNFAAYANIVWIRLFQGDTAGARAGTEAHEARFPQTFWKHRGRFIVEYHAGNPDAAHRAADSLSRHPDAPDRWRSRGVFYMALADLLAGRLSEARRHMDDEVRRSAEGGIPLLAFSREMDRVWIETVVVGDTAGAARRARSALEAGWLGEDGATRPPYFAAVRDAARAGAADVGERILEAWLASAGPPDATPGLREDLRVAAAFLDAARGGAARARTELQAVHALSDPRRLPTEWPSAHHCQRCYTFDMGVLSERVGDADSAIRYYESVVRDRDDLVETPLLKIVASERLGSLYEAAGDTAAALGAYGRVARAWSQGDGELLARGAAARARLEALTG